MRSVILQALVLATRAAEVEWLRSVAIPTVLSVDWTGFCNPVAVDSAREALTSWVNWPPISPLAPRVLERLGLAGPPQAGPLTGVTCARGLASFLDDNADFDAPDGLLASAAADTGLPLNPAAYTPAGFLTLARQRRVPPSRFTRYLNASALVRSLGSKRASLKPMASALRAWADYMDIAGLPHFPVATCHAVRFAAIFREPGTYRAYLSHVRSACELLGHDGSWASAPEVARAKCGLLKQGLVHKEPRHSVSAHLIGRIASVDIPWSRERFFLILAWVFMLRASSECTGILYGPGSPCLSNLHSPLPEGACGVIGLVGGDLVLRLRSRKTHLFGDCVKRSCTCSGGQGVSLYIPSALCPVHVLGVWLSANATPGARVFGHGIAQSALAFLRVALAARDVAHAERHGLHALRRGAAQALVDRGGSLPLLLKAGGWKSSAFKAYLDMVGLEDDVLKSSLLHLVDIDT